jgi:cytochrome c556
MCRRLSPPRFARGCLAGLFLLTGLLGCGGSPKSAPDGGAAAPAPTAGKPANGGPATTDDTSRHVRTDADGRKWIGDIPYDVFFDDPLGVVSNTQAAPTTSPAAGTPAVAATDTPATTPTAPAPSAGLGADWQSMISMEHLVDETKRIRNHLTASLQSQGTYNGNYKELQVDGAVMAAIAGIVAQHPENVTWKPNARFVKQYGQRLNQAARALGRDAFEQSQAAAEGITAVLNGNLPADAGDPEDSPFGEVASRAGVMKRIEKASEWMRANINSETVFQKEREQIQREATLLAVLGKVVSDASYESSDEDDYQAYARSLIEGGREAVSAAEDQAYPKFQDAINKITKACADCHNSYGNG